MDVSNIALCLLLTFDNVPKTGKSEDFYTQEVQKGEQAWGNWGEICDLWRRTLKLFPH